MAQYKTQKIFSKKWVYYSGTDTLKQGYILSYNSDLANDVDGNAVAEGLGCNSRFLDVEKPKTGNRAFPAGVVAPGFEGKVGPCWVEINEFIAGQIMEVFCNANCTNGTTLIYVANDSYCGSSSGLTLLGLAEETINRSITNGLVLVRIGLVSSSVMSDAAVALTSDVAVALSDGVIDRAKELSDVATVVSDELVKRNSDEKALSDGTIIASDAAAKASSDLTLQVTKEASDVKVFSDTVLKINSDAKILSDGTVAVSNALNTIQHTVLSDLVAGIDAAVAASYASDNCKKIGSDLVAALSNMIVVLSNNSLL